MGAALPEIRWIAVDTETSGLDPDRDLLLSIGACAIEKGRLELRASFEATLRQSQPSAVENVLVHGIGHRAQGAGAPPEEALAAYLRFARADVLVGYHTLFDLVMLKRAIRAALGIAYRPLHIDLALILPPLTGRDDAVGWELDRWLEHYRVAAFSRHHALGDACATAQLFLVALRLAQIRGVVELRDLLRLQKRQLELVQMRA